MERIINGNIITRNKYPWFCNIISASNQIPVIGAKGVGILGSAIYIGNRYVITAASLFTPYYRFNTPLELSSNTTIPVQYPLSPQFTDVAMDTEKNTKIIRMGHLTTYDDSVIVKDYKIVDFNFHPFYSYDYVDFQSKLADNGFSHTMWSNDLVILELHAVPALDGFEPINILPKNLEEYVYYSSDVDVVSIGTGLIQISPSDDVDFVDEFPLVIDANQDSIITTANYYVRDVPLKMKSSEDSLWASDTVVHINNYPFYQSGYLIVYYNTSFQFLGLELTSDIPAFAFDTTITSSNDEVNTFFSDIQVLFNTTFSWSIINNTLLYDESNSSTHPIMSIVPSDSLYSFLDVGKWLNWSLWELNPIQLQSPFNNVCYAADFGSDLNDIHDNSGLSLGDGGSPLVYQNSDNEYYLVGVHGFSVNPRLGISLLADNYPEIFESIEKHRDWINAIINSSDIVTKTIEELVESNVGQVENTSQLVELLSNYTSDLVDLLTIVSASDFSTDQIDISFGIELSSDLSTIPSDYKLYLEDIEIFDDKITEWDDTVNDWENSLFSFQEAVLICSSDGSIYYQLSSDLLEGVDEFTSDIAQWSSDILEWLSFNQLDVSILTSSDLSESSNISSDIAETEIALQEFTSDVDILNNNLASFSSDISQYQDSLAILSSDRESLEIITGPLNRELIEKDDSNKPDVYRDSNYNLLFSNRTIIFASNNNYYYGPKELCGINADYDVRLVGDATIISSASGEYYSMKVKSVGDKVIRQSRRYFNLFSGSIELSGTLSTTMSPGVTSKIGWFNGTDGYYFMLDENNIYIVELINGTEHAITMNNWNLDSLDITQWVTPTSIPQVSDLRTNNMTMIYQICNETIMIGLMIDGIPRLLHKFLTSHLSKPKHKLSFPIRYEINKAGEDNQVTSEMRMAISVIYNHDNAPINQIACFNRELSLTNARSSKIKVTSSIADPNTALTPIFSMRVRQNLPGTIIQITSLELMSVSENQLYWELTLNPDIKGLTWLKDSNSLVELDDEAYAYHNGLTLASGLIDHKSFINSSELTHALASFNIDKESDVIVLGIRNLSSSDNNTDDIDFWYKISWVET